MTWVQILIGRTRSMMRKAAVLVAAVQIVVGGAPFAESGSRSASAHVEDAGVQLHYAHAEELCIGCAALKVWDRPAAAGANPFSELTGSPRPAAMSDRFDQRLDNGPPRSRAPPSFLIG
jgi:hypothetical protein